jgi:hypothetical protein
VEISFFDEESKEGQIMFVITIGKDATISEAFIQKKIEQHETEQDPVVVVYSELVIPTPGFAITRFDGLVSDFVKANPELLKEDSVKKELYKQKERLSKEKFYNQ